MTGGEACGVYKEVEIGPPSHSIGTVSNLLYFCGERFSQHSRYRLAAIVCKLQDLNLLRVKRGEQLVMSISMWAADLYSVQFVCGGGGGGDGRGN